MALPPFLAPRPQPWRSMRVAMSADSRKERARLLMQAFQAALAAEKAAREAYHQDPRNPETLRDWLRAMDATHEASKKLRDGTAE